MTYFLNHVEQPYYLDMCNFAQTVTLSFLSLFCLDMSSINTESIGVFE